MKSNNYISFFPISLLLIVSVTSLSFAQTLDERVNNLLNQMTLQEKILQLHHEGGFNTATNLRLGINGFVMADGPHGVREGNATSFPVGISMAATWDPELIYRVGIGMGKEFKGKGKNQALGPCMDMTRDPRNGRSAESGGEDPLLNATITTSLIKGIQSTGVIATAKHYNGVNRQDNRFNNQVTMSLRDMMEFYGQNFKSAVQNGGALSVMNAYNLINGEKCAENHYLLTDILRDYWGFPYYVVSDWGSIWSSEKAIKAGCSVCMGSDNYQNDLLNLVNNNQVSESVIDNAVRDVLRTKILAGLTGYFPHGNPSDVNSVENQQLSLEAAKKSIVLLKNNGNILPIDKNSVTKIAIVGPSANVAQVDGTGSSYVTPFYSVSPYQGFINKLGSNKIVYAKGCDINSSDTSGFAEARTLAQNSDVVIFVGGLDKTQEGEGLDRVGGSIQLPGVQQELINVLAGNSKKLVVVLEGGGICGINDCVDNINALIYAFYPGQEGGNAIADVVLGGYNPAGRLPVTMPKTDNQLPDPSWQKNPVSDYLIGYRWYDEKNITPQFAFGYGLSYTTFEYSNLVVTPASASEGQIVTVSCNVKNTGSRAGEEVVQLYLKHNNSNIVFPVKQLKGFNRISLNAGEIKTVTFNLNSEDLYYFDENVNSYKVDPGQYTAMVGGSSDNLPLTANFEIISATPQPDLVISNIRWFPAYPVKGDSVVFLATVKNVGTGASPSGQNHKVSFKINGEVVSASLEFNGSIPAGGMKMVCATTGPNSENFWVADSKGNFNVEAEVDPDNNISECVENNNTFNTEVTVLSVPPTNIAINKTVYVSSVEKSGVEGNYAVDGSLSSRWSSQFSDPQYIYIDLGKVTHIEEIDLFWEYAYGKEYFLQVSDDAVSWRDLDHITNGDGGQDMFQVSTDARYVRMYGIKRGTVYGYSLYEFEVYSSLTATGLHSEKDKSSIPSKFFLDHNYPNPFNPSTTIKYGLPEASKIKIIIYNTLGQKVTELVNSEMNAGFHQVTWDASNCSSGIYICMLETDKFKSARKLVLMK